ncbi:MAG: hypothetical protein J6A94_12635 [Lachnospiraceae bacterium]|nr:hypothetical protein [Lachnospiraceae bacterium]
MKNGKKVFWGVLFLIGAVALLVGKLGYFGGLNFWTILITIGLIGFLVEGIVDRSFGMILFALAFLIIVHDKLLGLEAITPMPVLGAAFLGTIGLDMLFPKKKWKKHMNMEHKAINEETKEQSMDGEHVYFQVTFGEAVRYVTSNNLKNVNAQCNFGSLEIYLNNACLKEGQAVVNVDCSFGQTVLYVPGNWNVVQQAKATLGGIEEKGYHSPDGQNTLIVAGSVSFGAIEIRYI